MELTNYIYICTFNILSPVDGLYAFLKLFETMSQNRGGSLSTVPISLTKLREFSFAG